jgi:CO/xanthine dehydrogenase Mo-binding subunit
MRGFGNPEMLFAQESLIDVAAEKLGIEPFEIRLKNCSQKGDITAHGWILNTCGLDECIREVTKRSQGRRSKTANHGLGMACQVHVSGIRGSALYEGSAAFVNIDECGKVKVVSGESEIGQGSSTIFVQIVSEETGIRMEDIEILPFVDSEVTPFAMGTFASRVTTLGGNAVLLAARDAKEKLLHYASEKLNRDMDDLTIENSTFYALSSGEKLATLQEIAHQTVMGRLGGLPITGRGEYVVPDYVVPADPDSKYGNYSVAYAFGAQAAEVEVDPTTGEIKVLNVWVAQDVGRVLHPKMCEGQVEGGVVQAIGYATREAYLWDRGRVLNPDFRDYKIPDFCSTPRIHCSWVESNEPAGPFGAKSIGEAVFNPTAAAIANAVYDAIGIRSKELPITPQRIREALRDADRGNSD